MEEKLGYHMLAMSLYRVQTYNSHDMDLLEIRENVKELDAKYNVYCTGLQV